MKFSKQWLQTFLTREIETEELLRQLPMLGHEIDVVEPVAGAFTGVIVAEIAECVQHPNADRLRICRVNTGSETVQIVCGGKNARAGIKVALAMEGAVLPGDLKIKRGKIRGEESMGMLCSEVELGLAESSDGILELPQDAPVGMDIRKYLDLDDVSIELDLTPNRGDCLSVQGVAREVAVKNGCGFIPLKINEIIPSIDAGLPVNVEAPEVCPHYFARIIQGVNPAAQTPLWMKEKLRRSGLRSISPIVDVTNYVLLELGQPLHAFDLEKLNDQIIVRFAREGEKIILLNGETIELKSSTLVIADSKGPIAVAGVMGGLESGCTLDTTTIFLESALFLPEKAAGTARQYGMHTDSSHRFERGVDPELQQQAIERATELLLQIVGGEAGVVLSAISKDNLPLKKIINLSKTRVEKMLGLELPTFMITQLLTQLHMQVNETETGWDVLPPGFRYDINQDVDLIEEIARFHGYDNIPLHHPQSPVGFLAQKETERGPKDWRSCLVGRGYHEAVCYTFVDPKMQQLLEPRAKALALNNPISADLSVMRTSLWAGLLQAVLHNQNRQNNRVRLFEMGKRFVQINDVLQQQEMLAGVITDTLQPVQWAEKKRPLDFYDIKGDIEAILDLTGNSERFSFAASEHSALHPGQSSKLIYNGNVAGWMGALHPQIQQALDLKGPVYLFEIEQDALRNAELSVFEKLSRFPAISRDLALTVKDGVTAADIQQVIHRAAGSLLTDSTIFDVYRGKGICDGHKSVAVTLTLQDKERTLVDAEVNELMNRVVQALKQEVEASLRE